MPCQPFPDRLRRKLIKTVATAWLSIPCYPLLYSVQAMAATPTSQTRRILWLFQRLTGVKRFNHRFIQQLLVAVKHEPSGTDHLHRVLSKLAPEPLDNDMAQLPIDIGVLDDGERWFVQHLLISLMTGIYFHEQRGNFTLSYRYALMHDALQDIRPIPGTCQQHFGFWQHPPAQ